MKDSNGKERKKRQEQMSLRENKVEILAPAGSYDILMADFAAGADAVYLGGAMFGARAYANNLSQEELLRALDYAHLHDKKIYLTVNTLMKQQELEDRLLPYLEPFYKAGLSAVIVQDFGAFEAIKEAFPGLHIHASTQMTVTGAAGAKLLKEAGASRVVTARELNLAEIKAIHDNCDIEIESFIHGALCYCYSGQCLLSSFQGGRSGNRGRCAQPCRLMYTPQTSDMPRTKGKGLRGDENRQKDSNGSAYLLSPKDMCGLPVLPDIIEAGVYSLKIEGRMKSPEYVAIVTKIYRKYIDLANECIESNNLENYIIDSKDIKDLMQVFNRGGFSNGHIDNSANKNLIFKEKPNNMGLFLGIVEKYNPNKGHITVKLNEQIAIGDTISLQNETGSYTISELLKKDKNITETNIGDTVIIGRMKGNIKSGDKIYKISSKKLSTEARESFSKEHKKTMLNATITIKKDKPISMQITPSFQLPEIYQKMNIKVELPEAIPVEAKNRPLEAENIILQITKTKSFLFIKQVLKTITSTA